MWPKKLPLQAIEVTMNGMLLTKRKLTILITWNEEMASFSRAVNEENSKSFGCFCENLLIFWFSVHTSHTLMNVQTATSWMTS